MSDAVQQGSSSPGERDAAAAWETLLAHELFNKVNNAQPLQLLDLRQPAQFQALKLRGSRNVSDSDDIGAVVRALLTRSSSEREIRGFRCIVVLASRGTTTDGLHLRLQQVCDVIRDLRGKLQRPRNNGPSPTPSASSSSSSTSFVAELLLLHDAETFFEVYQPCSAMFEFGDAQPRPTTRRYYASEILPGALFLGDYVNATDAQQLRELAITHIIDATCQAMSEPVARELGLQYLAVDVWDSEDADIAAFFAQTNAFIASALVDCATPGRVLVHCRAGWSRSPSLVLAFLMNHLRIDLTTAARMCVRQRPFVCPNSAFREQLIRYELELWEDIGGASLSWSLCVGPEPLRQAILEASCLFSQSLTVETDFDRIPIAAFRARDPPAAEAEGLLIGEQTSVAPGVAKPKKPFLRRGQGRSAQSRATPIQTAPQSAPQDCSGGGSGGAGDSDPAPL